MAAVLLAVGLAPAAPIPPAVAARSARLAAEGEAFRGRWKMVEAGQGESRLDGSSFDSEADFRGGVVVYRNGGRVASHHLVRLDPDARPARIDLTQIEPPAAGRPPRPVEPDKPPRRRVYRVAGDTLVIAAFADADRPGYPSRVVSAPEPGFNYYIYRRVAADLAPPPRPAP